jgi:uncharacterized membrane protein
MSAPPLEDPVWEGSSEIVGGPLGRYAGPRRGLAAWLTPTKALLLLTALSAILAYVIKMPCFGIGWSAPDVFSRGCYSDWPVIFTGRGLADGTFPFITPGSQVEYPVLMAIFTALVAVVTPGMGADHARIVAYFDINAVLAAAAWMGLTLVTAATAVRLRAAGAFQGLGSERPRWGSGIERAAAVALSPAIIVTAYINWDIYAVLFASAALWAIVARKWVWAGVFIGLGTAFKLYPILLLGVIFLGALRAPKAGSEDAAPSGRQGEWRGFAVATGVSVVTWLLANVPAMLADFTAWKYFLDFSKERGASYGSIWFLYNLTAEKNGVAALTPERINTLAMVLLIAGLLAVVAFAWFTPVRAQPAQLAFLIVSIFILTNKVYSPQYVIWLVPLAVLAGLSWRALIAWQIVEVLHWWATWEAITKWTTNGNSQHTLPDVVYVWSVMAHIVAVVAIMGWIVYQQFSRPGRARL